MIERALLELECVPAPGFAEALARLTSADHCLVFALGRDGRHRLRVFTALPEAASRHLAEDTLDPGNDPLLADLPGRVALRVGDLEGVPCAAFFPEARWALAGVDGERTAVLLCFGRRVPPTVLERDPVLAGALLRRTAERVSGGQATEQAAGALARLSHEFKTPLVSIKGYAELILDAQEEIPGPRLRDWARRIASAANRLAALCHKATAETRAEEEWTYGPRPVDPVAWVRRGVEEVQALASGRGLRWTWEAGEDLGPVALDPDGGRDMLVELLQNAARATPDGGEVRVSLRREDRSGKDGVRLTVRDTGVGIPEGEGARSLFQRFVTLGGLMGHHSGDFEFGSGGLGLGLSLVKGIAAAHQGEVWAEGRGRDPETLPGSAFHVWLPLCAEESARAPTAEVEQGSRGKLLVVDADAEASRILAEALAESHTVRTAGGAREALELWSAEGPWEACIVDPRMPEGGGVDLLRALRRADPSGQTPLVVYTATAVAGETTAWRAAGAQSCVWKPARTRVLVQRIRTLKDRRRRP